jgi:hypothetical protein
MTGLDRRSAEARELIETAERASVAADRAFARFIRGEVEGSSAATRLAHAAEEAWADVRLDVEGGDLIEAGWDEARIAEALEEVVR